MKNWLKGGLIGAGFGILLLIIAIISDRFKVCNAEMLNNAGYFCHHFITEYVGVFFLFINPLAWIGYGAIGTPSDIFSIMITGIIFLFIYGAILSLIYNKNKIAFGIILGLLLGLIVGVILTALFGEYVKQMFLIIAPLLGAIIGGIIYRSKK